jgi:subfamily B ATP-binding cassette protein MsbA
LNQASKAEQKVPKVERLRAILPEVWKLMRPRRGLLALGFALMVINRVAALVLPYSTKFLIDTVIVKHHMDKLEPLVLVV